MYANNLLNCIPNGDDWHIFLEILRDKGGMNWKMGPEISSRGS